MKLGTKISKIWIKIEWRHQTEFAHRIQTLRVHAHATIYFEILAPYFHDAYIILIWSNITNLRTRNSRKLWISIVLFLCVVFSSSWKIIREFGPWANVHMFVCVWMVRVQTINIEICNRFTKWKRFIYTHEKREQIELNVKFINRSFKPRGNKEFLIQKVFNIMWHIATNSQEFLEIRETDFSTTLSTLYAIV